MNVEPDQGERGEHCREELLAALTEGRPLHPGARAHLAVCRECREDWELLSGVQDVVVQDAATPAVAPPPGVRGELLRQARAMTQAEVPVPGQPPRPSVSPLPAATQARRPVALFPRLALGAAAVLAALTLGSLLLPQNGLAHALPDPAVVVNAGGPLLVASNGAAGPGVVQTEARLALISGERVSATLALPAPHPAWFTEGVRLGDRVYLADAGNNLVLEVQTGPLRVVRSFPVRGGVAGLGVGGGRVYYKSVSGEVGVLPTPGTVGRRMSLASAGAPQAPLPMADVMDAVLLQGDTLYVTHHLLGELCLLDPQTLAVRRRVRLGGAPVALAGLQGGLLVLDVAGRLLRLNAAGEVGRSWPVPGHPDKLVLNGSLAVMTDRAGAVTQLDLNSGAVVRTTLPHPMDVTLTEDGHLAVAQGQTGVALLGMGLKPMPGGEIR